MLVKISSFTTTVLFMAGLALANPITNAGAEGLAVRNTDVVDNIDIATDAYHACNCPNNCSHKLGSKCKFYTNSGAVVSGHCANDGGKLVCS